MYDQIAVIHQDPSGSLIALDLTALMTGFAEFFLYIICHCLYLAGVASVCDDKVISQYRYSMNINDANIFAFFIFQRLYGKFGQLFCFHGDYPPHYFI